MITNAGKMSVEQQKNQGRLSISSSTDSLRARAQGDELPGFLRVAVDDRPPSRHVFPSQRAAGAKLADVGHPLGQARVRDDRLVELVEEGELRVLGEPVKVFLFRFFPSKVRELVHFLCNPPFSPPRKAKAKRKGRTERGCISLGTFRQRRPRPSPARGSRRSR